ncbi:hypothetical protein EJB05_13799, partial [Eragrostis curvula]
MGDRSANVAASDLEQHKEVADTFPNSQVNAGISLDITFYSDCYGAQLLEIFSTVRQISAAMLEQ